MFTVFANNEDINIFNFQWFLTAQWYGEKLMIFIVLKLRLL